MEKKNIGIKDLVNLGLFTAIYFVLFFISGMTGLIPVMAVFYPVLLAVLGGIPCILFFSKTQKFGLVTMMGILMGLITFFDGLWSLCTDYRRNLRRAGRSGHAYWRLQKLETYAYRLLPVQRMGGGFSDDHVYLQRCVSGRLC